MTKRKTSKLSRAAAHTPKKPATARDLGAALGEAIRGAAPEIVNALIDQALHGNTTPTKFLFDFAGLTSSAAPDPAAEQSLAALLLQELSRDPAQAEEPEAGTIQ